MAEDFVAKIRAFRDKALLNATTVVQEATTEAAADLVARTPVDTTALRANWQFTAGAPGDVEDYSLRDESPGGADTISALSEQIRRVPAGGVTYVVNNLSYMPTIEYGLYTDRTGGRRHSGKTTGGFSTQAPAGVRGVVVEQWLTFVANAVEKIKV